MKINSLSWNIHSFIVYQIYKLFRKIKARALHERHAYDSVPDNVHFAIVRMGKFLNDGFTKQLKQISRTYLCTSKTPFGLSSTYDNGTNGFLTR